MGFVLGSAVVPTGRRGGGGWGKGQKRGEKQMRERNWSRSLEDHMEEGMGVEAPWWGWGCGFGWGL